VPKRFKEGYLKTKPVIDRVLFEKKGMMSIYLEDGRIIIVPLSKFPSIKRLSAKQRTKYSIADGQVIIFLDCDEVFHIEQILGSEQVYRYSIAS